VNKCSNQATLWLGCALSASAMFASLYLRSYRGEQPGFIADIH